MDGSIWLLSNLVRHVKVFRIFLNSTYHRRIHSHNLHKDRMVVKLSTQHLLV